MNKIPFDDNPEYGGLINFASNGVENMLDAFNYGFKLGWKTCWREHNPDSPTTKELDLLARAREEAYKQGYRDGGLVYMGDTDMQTAKKAREEFVEEILLFLEDLEIRQPEDLKTSNWRNWKYIRNSIRDKYLHSLDKGEKECH